MIDNNNNVCIAGSFSSASLTFGPISITNNTSGSSDIFLAKFDSLGNIIWARRQVVLSLNFSMDSDSWEQ
ncbi:MAG: hypothetical protein IPP34_07790 [Bacteroidetes bacterium]|nr:hypothetical protein [Bacteroidota bacterium]